MRIKFLKYLRYIRNIILLLYIASFILLALSSELGGSAETIKSIIQIMVFIHLSLYAITLRYVSFDRMSIILSTASIIILLVVFPLAGILMRLLIAEEYGVVSIDTAIIITAIFAPMYFSILLILTYQLIYSEKHHQRYTSSFILTFFSFFIFIIGWWFIHKRIELLLQIINQSDESL